jgi:3-isopropylmalate/(R)-2-methylmalate dehydratase small subunit
MKPFTNFESRVVALPVNNIDTDQISPARFLKTTSKDGLGDQLFCDWRYDAQGRPKPDFVLNQPGAKGAQILLVGDNFGCGSSREHAPIALGSAGCKIVLAESFARIFFRNSVATGELYPCEIVERLCDTLKNGEVVTVDLDAATVTVKATGKVFKFKPLGDVRPVVDAGGLFNYARQSGMIAAQK